jgi:hypothetical protein
VAIRHTVVFSLAHPADSTEEAEFLDYATRTLGAIGPVTNFVVSRQISPKSDLRWQFSMDFASESDYEAYNADPAHVQFVSTKWGEVTDFQEYDFVAR